MELFDLYWILLIVSGVLMLGLGFSGFGGSSKGVRAINLIFGAGFIGYGVYLGLFFTGGTYIIFFKAFIVPVLLIVNAIRSRSAQANAPAANQPPTWQPAPGQTAPNQAPVTPWAVPNQATGAPQSMAAQPPLTPQPPLTAPTLTSDDVLGR